MRLHQLSLVDSEVRELTHVSPTTSPMADYFMAVGLQRPGAGSTFSLRLESWRKPRCLKRQLKAEDKARIQEAIADLDFKRRKISDTIADYQAQMHALQEDDDKPDDASPVGNTSQRSMQGA